MSATLRSQPHRLTAQHCDDMSFANCTLYVVEATCLASFPLSHMRSDRDKSAGGIPIPRSTTRRGLSIVAVTERTCSAALLASSPSMLGLWVGGLQGRAVGERHRRLTWWSLKFGGFRITSQWSTALEEVERQPDWWR